jgi:hypothetical protein
VAAESVDDHHADFPVDRRRDQEPQFQSARGLIEEIFAAEQLVLVPIDGNDRGFLGERGREVFVTDHAHDPAGAPEKAHQAHADDGDDAPRETAHRSHPTFRAGLFLVESIAQLACVFGIGWHPARAGKKRRELSVNRSGGAMK